MTTAAPVMEYRTYTPDLEVRTSGDGRTVFGIAVPYNVPMRIDEDLIEEFAPGVVNAQLRAANRVRFSREHVELGGIQIGRLTEMRDDTAGLYVEMRAAKTPLGDQTLEEIREGILTDLSVAFWPVPNGNQLRRTAQGLITRRLSVRLDEVAITTEGAYGSHAVAQGLRSLQSGSIPMQTRGHRGAAIELTPNIDRVRALLVACPPLPPMPAGR